MAEPRHAATPAGQGGPAPVLAVAAFAVFVIIAAAARVDWQVTSRFNPLDSAREYTPTPLPQQSAPSDVETPELTTVGWAAPVFWVVLSIIGLVLAVLLGRWLWRIRPRRRVEVVEPGAADPEGLVLLEEQAAALRRGTLTALDLLDELADPQDAVVRSWLALEHAAVSTGAPRRRSDSPSEFVRGLLAATGADRDAVNTLLRLYHRARFSAHPVGLEEVRQARSCVAELSRSLAGYERALRADVESVRRDRIRSDPP